MLGVKIQWSAGGEANNLDLRIVSGVEQQEDLEQNREKDLFSRVLEILDRLEKLESETSKRSQDIFSLKDETQLTYLLTYSMVQSPSWGANWFASS